VILGLQCTIWLVSMVEVALRNAGVKDKSFREGQQVLIVRRGGNRASHFLELAMYAEGSCDVIHWPTQGFTDVD
jgi:hypothetical protein